MMDIINAGSAMPEATLRFKLYANDGDTIHIAESAVSLHCAIMPRGIVIGVMHRDASLLLMMLTTLYSITIHNFL